MAAAGPPDAQLVLEPGRSLVCRAGVTLYRSASSSGRARRHVRRDRRRHVGQPAPGAVRRPLHGAAREPRRRAGGRRLRGRRQALRVGRRADRARSSCREPERGDLLAVPATGAYTLAMSSTYNAVPRPAVVLVSRRRGAPDPPARDGRRPARATRPSSQIPRSATAAARPERRGDDSAYAAAAVSVGATSKGVRPLGGATTRPCRRTRSRCGRLARRRLGVLRPTHTRRVRDRRRERGRRDARHVLGEPVGQRTTPSPAVTPERVQGPGACDRRVEACLLQRPGRATASRRRTRCRLGDVLALVADSVTKSGSTVSGHFTGMVVIEPDPGYAGDPGHAGTGTVVGTSDCSGSF